MPSVKYNAWIYPTEQECLVAKKDYEEVYEAKPQEYRDKLITKAFCLPFDSFPITGMRSPTGA